MELLSTRPQVAPRGRLTMQPPGGGPRRPPRPLRPARAALFSWPRAGLVLLLAATLGLRLWGIKQGLPFSYNTDEAQHFVPKAIQFFSGDWNPHYFMNPPAFSYLLAIVFELWFGSVDAAVRAFTLDPTSVYVLARVIVALLGTGSVWLSYGAGVKLLGSSGRALAGAAIFGLAFLPIFYSHLALNDVPTLFCVCLGLYGIAGVWRDGRRRDYLLAGVGIGLAAATKYTGGWIAVLLLVAAAHHAWGTGTGPARPVPTAAPVPDTEGSRDGARRAEALSWTVAAFAVGVLAFSVANPYWFLDWHEFISGVSAQASATGGPTATAKLGTAPGGGILYYLWTFGWGLGLGPSVAAVAGAAALLARRRWWMAALFIPGEILFIVFMGLQVRYFGRWLMPVFPMVSLLAGWSAGELIGWLGALRRPVPGLLAGVVIAAGLLTQSLISVIHNDRVLSRPYTTNLARDWMIAHIPAGQNVYIEPIIPGNWTDDTSGTDAFEPDGARWSQYPTFTTTVNRQGRPLPHGQRRVVTLDEYEDTLYPGLIAKLEANAYCWVVSGTLQSGRAFVTPQQDPGAIAYYRELARVGTLVFTADPYAPGDHTVPFGFDWSIDYYPHQYELPGPEVTIWHLTGGACAG